MRAPAQGRAKTPSHISVWLSGPPGTAIPKPAMYADRLTASTPRRPGASTPPPHSLEQHGGGGPPHHRPRLAAAGEPATEPGRRRADAAQPQRHPVTCTLPHEDAAVDEEHRI